MSFSSSAKSAASSMPKTRAEQKAMLYGMLIFSNVYTDKKIVFRTETAEVSDILCGLLLGVCDVMASPEVFVKENGAVYRIKIENERDLAAVSAEFGAIRNDSIDETQFHGKSCDQFFIKGAFLSCGYINSPENPYRLDFTVESGDLAVALAVVLSKCVGEMPKLSVRKSSQVVYFRESNIIVDFLNIIGLTSHAFEIMNSQIERDIRNNLNRKTNFDVANIGKKAAASVLQTEAINKIIARGDFEKLPITLRTTAKLRLEMPDASLEAIGDAENPPISKSQVSKRLARLIEISKKQ